MRVMERPVSGEGAIRELASPPGLGRLEDVSPDGRTLLFSRGPLDTAVFSFGLDGVQKDPKSLVQTAESLARPLLAGRALDFVHRYLLGARRDLRWRRNLRSAVPGARLTEAGDQPWQLSGVAQGWTGNRLPG